MKPAVLVGIILAIIGVAALGYQGFTYTTRKKVVDIGPIEITKDTKHSLPVSPILGVAALAGGVVLIVTGSGKRG
jgi:hypothetical protein